MTGSDGPSILEGVAKPTRDYWEIAVARLKEGTTEELIKTHCQAKGIETREVKIIPSKIKGTVTAKVRVALNHKDLALNGESWPTHLRVSSWTNKSKAFKQNGNRTQAETQNGS